MTINMTAIVDTIPVATSTGSMGASHTGLGVYEYGFSMRGNTLGVSTHREPFSYTPWGFPEHAGFPASYSGHPKIAHTLLLYLSWAILTAQTSTK